VLTDGESDEFSKVQKVLFLLLLWFYHLCSSCLCNFEFHWNFVGQSCKGWQVWWSTAQVYEYLMTLGLQEQSVIVREASFPHKGDLRVYIELSGNWLRGICFPLLLAIM
jgi:hypothetical protein